ncbi:MAG TPA: haloacid dehalogenase type II [Stellaceae bacterium]|jgi:2-haloacid dehalogenase|nr:haloacid dehalogenase type II [Stellaceae bacterium]
MASATPLTGIRACIFDAYGTLFDFASAAVRCADVLGDKADALTPLWRDKQLQYTWLRAAQNRHADFWRVTGDALDFALETLGIADARGALHQRLMDCYLTLDAFSDAPAMLRRVKAAGFASAILSNGTPAMVAAAVEHAGLGGMLDHLLTVEEVGVFKPARAVYQLAADRLGIAMTAVAFLSSNAWDIHAASAFGFCTVWCNRTGQRRERLPGAPDREIATLADLPELLGI